MQSQGNKRKSSQQAFKSIDLFAGIGGIRKGFEQAFGKSLSTVFVSELDKFAQKTYRYNFSTPSAIHGDIKEVSAEDIPSFDICLAGFPCQAFSMAGHRKGFDDDHHGINRGELFFEVSRICEHHKPKVIFCENVKGLLSHNKGETYKRIEDELIRIGYKPFKQILNSRNFGVPQSRERLYIVAFREDIAPEHFEFPSHKATTKTIRDIMEKEAVSVKYYLSAQYLETLRKHKINQAKKGNGFSYDVRSLDTYANTIICGGMGRERNLIIDPRQKDLTPITHIVGEVNKEGIRRMTPREWARLQGFDDSFQLKLADVHLYKQLGNSVTVSVIKEIAESIKKHLQIG